MQLQRILSTEMDQQSAYLSESDSDSGSNPLRASSDDCELGGKVETSVKLLGKCGHDGRCCCCVLDVEKRRESAPPALQVEISCMHKIAIWLAFAG